MPLKVERKLYTAIRFATFITVNRALHLKRSPLKRLSCPIAKSNKLREPTRGGLWSSFSAPAAGICNSVEPYCDAGQMELGLMGVKGVACTEPQKSPA